MQTRIDFRATSARVPDISQALSEANIDNTLVGHYQNRIELRNDIMLSELEAVVAILYVFKVPFQLTHE